MTLLGRLLGAGGLVFLAALGCQGEAEDEDGDGGAAPVAADDFAARFARAYCTGISACCQRFEETFDQASCTSVSEGIVRAALAGALASSKVVFDEGVAGRCIAAYSDALAACTDRDLVNDLDGPCEGLTKGTVPAGGECSQNEDCRDESAFCDAGVCVVDEPYVSPEDSPHGSLGDACSQTCEASADGGYGCGGSSAAPRGAATCWVEDGLACAADYTCQPAPDAGEPCPSFYCATGAYCNLGTCAAPSADGPCNSELACVASSYCDYDLGQCAPRKPDGAPCNSREECLGGDCEGDRCRPWSVANAEACAGQIDD